MSYGMARLATEKADYSTRSANVCLVDHEE